MCLVLVMDRHLMHMSGAAVVHTMTNISFCFHCWEDCQLSGTCAVFLRVA
jgi:hypothetical protein